MVDSISSRVSAGALTEGATGGNDLGRDSFLKLLVAQLQNQDPLNPQDNHEFVAQLAQFSSLEQTVGINDRLDQLSLQTQGLANSQVVGLVGKEATIKGDIVTLQGQGDPVPISFTLSSASTEALVEIRDGSGRRVRTLEVGARSAGTVSVLWNGQNDTGLPQSAGPYQIRVTAKNGDTPISVTQQSQGVITSVSFSQGFPIIKLESGVSAPVADLLEVSPAPSKP